MEEDYNNKGDLHVESSIDSSSGSMSCSSLEMADHDHDEEVSSTSSQLGPLYELSDLMAQLPIKRGLSKFYDGKSQSYTSLMSVRSIEDLLKKDERPCNNKRFKIGGSKKVFSPKATISMKKQQQGRRRPNTNKGSRSRSPFFIFNNGQKKNKGSS